MAKIVGTRAGEDPDGRVLGEVQSAAADIKAGKTYEQFAGREEFAVIGTHVSRQDFDQIAQAITLGNKTLENVLKDLDKNSLPPGISPDRPSFNVIINTKEVAAAFQEAGTLLRANMTPTSRTGSRALARDNRAPASAAV